jgi:hypothetical protein
MSKDVEVNNGMISILLFYCGESVSGQLGPSSTCAVQRRDFPVGDGPHPATFAPAGSNRSSRGGDEAAEAFGVEGHLVDL